MDHFTNVDAWNGGHYELGLELGTRSDERLRSALRSVWAHEHLAGPYAHADAEPSSQAAVTLLDGVLESTLFGIATIPDVGRTACLTVPIRFDDGIDWLYFCFPLGSLGRIMPVGGFPISAPGSWVETVEDWLATLGRHVFMNVEFSRGVIGFETDVDRWVGTDEDEPRSESLLVSRSGRLEFLPRSVVTPGSGPSGR